MKENWFKKLNPDEYRVMREAGTEAPFTSELNAHYENGNYHCKGCDVRLFSSSSKFDGHCGWPSFDLEIEEGILEKKRDVTHGMIRTEIVCSKCKSHLGHLFDDGPTDTGLRYCVNGISLTFSKDKEQDWFENWFDSPYYPLLYQKRNIEEAESFISNLLTDLKPAPKSRILDLACGEGRHSNYLASKGFKVTGIDLSERSIVLAKENAVENVDFDIADMREFSINSKYEYIFNLFTSFGYFQNTNDNIKVLNQIRKHLDDSGTLVIDFLNKHLVVKNLVPSETKTVDQITFNITRKVQDGSVVKNITFKADNIENKYQERVQLFDLNDFQQMLDQSGFKIINTYGEYDLSTFNEDSSSRLIIIAEKK